ncbi:hypothetical protein [Qipengyuania proteolytica]|uniref:hypothetical protein n=1 Tax=Qipengyuania proteolytica TaxID=2867239 RepID=UPI001FFDB31E|nr:hypothetical protein [Qipengyuania proteolytica]
MMLGFDQGRTTRILLLAPLFDEANKFRRQLVEIMRRLDQNGIDSFLPDMPGCNESLARHGEQSLARWQEVAARAADHVRATHVFAIRSGSWLAPEAHAGWLYAPARPAKILRSLARARTLAAREAGRDETVDSLLEQGRTKGIELTGWELGSRLVGELETAQFEPAAAYSVIEQADIGGKPLWLRAENDVDPAQADALVALILAGLSA